MAQKDRISGTNRYSSLVVALADHWDKKRAQLPQQLRDRLARELSRLVWDHWDTLTEDGRHSQAEMCDYNNDPALEGRRTADWDAVSVDWRYWQKVPSLTAQEFCILRHVHDPRKFGDEQNNIPGGEGETLGERVSDDMRIITRLGGDQNQLPLAEWIVLAEEQSWAVPLYMRAAVGSEDAADAQGRHPTFVTARTIENAFIIPKVNDSNAWWRTRMGNAARYGLDGCRANRGRGNVPSLWYPDRIAGWLEDKGHLTKKQLANILRKHFPDFADIADLLDPPKDG